jgi:hypothetical protein
MEDTKPNQIRFYYMHDNHAFSRLKGQTPKQIIEHCNEIRKTSYYGMLCPIILLLDDKEIRRVGVSAHCPGPNNDAEWKHNVAEWAKSINADADVLRLISTNTPRDTWFLTCPTHGWTERVASEGPCKKCAEEAVSPFRGKIGDTENIDIRISDYLPDNVMFINSATYVKFVRWIHNMQIGLNDEKQKSV